MCLLCVTLALALFVCLWYDYHVFLLPLSVHLGVDEKWKLFHYSVYFYYYSWPPLHFLTLFIGPTILFQLIFTFIYSTFNNNFQFHPNTPLACYTYYCVKCQWWSIDYDLGAHSHDNRIWCWVLSKCEIGTCWCGCKLNWFGIYIYIYIYKFQWAPINNYNEFITYAF